MTTPHFRAGQEAYRQGWPREAVPRYGDQREAEWRAGWEFQRRVTENPEEDIFA